MEKNYQVFFFVIINNFFNFFLVNCIDGLGNGPLHYAAMGNHIGFLFLFHKKIQYIYI